METGAEPKRDPSSTGSFLLEIDRKVTWPTPARLQAFLQLGVAPGSSEIARNPEPAAFAAVSTLDRNAMTLRGCIG
jgi:hypothetical protein